MQLYRFRRRHWFTTVLVLAACEDPNNLYVAPDVADPIEVVPPEPTRPEVVVPVGQAWVRAFETGDPSSFATDRAGNLLVAGLYRVSIDLGGGPRVPPPDTSYSPFVAKYSPEGELLLALTFTGYTLNSEGQVVHLLVGEDDSITIASSYHGPLNLGGGPLPFDSNSFDAFVAKFDAEGRPLWSRGFSGPEYQGVAGLAQAPDGGLWLSGSFKGRLTLDDHLLQAEEGDIYLAHLDRDGKVLDARRYGGALNEQAFGLAAMPDGGVVLTGGFNGEVDFGAPGKVTALDDLAFEGFVLRVGPDGEGRWVRTLRGVGRQAVTAVAAAQTGDVVIAGVFSGPLEGLGESALIPSPGVQAMFLAALDPDGAPRWQRAFDEPLDLFAHPLTIDDRGEIHFFRATLGGELRVHRTGLDGVVAADEGLGVPVALRAAFATHTAYALCGRWWRLDQPSFLGQAVDLTAGPYFVVRTLR